MLQFEMIKMEMRRNLCLPEVTIILSTDHFLADRILIQFFNDVMQFMIDKNKGLVEPIGNAQNEIDKSAKASLVCKVLFPTEAILTSFQEEFKKGGAFK